MPVGKSSCFSSIVRSWSPISLRPSHLILELYTYTSFGIRSWISNWQVCRTCEQTADIVVGENRDKKVTQWYRLYQDIQLFCKRKTVLMWNAMEHVWKRNWRKKNEHLSFVAWRAWPSISQRSSFSRSCSDYFRLLIELLSIRTIVENFTCPPYRVLHVFIWVSLTVIVFFSRVLFP